MASTPSSNYVRSVIVVQFLLRYSVCKPTSIGM